MGFYLHRDREAFEKKEKSTELGRNKTVSISKRTL